MANTNNKDRTNADEPSESRDPEDRPTKSEQARREKNLDKTLADSFPTSDPPSATPDPSGDT